MTVITTRLTVGARGGISAADRLPEGEYAACHHRAGAARPATEHPRLPVQFTAPGTTASLLRREDMYGDDGR